MVPHYLKQYGISSSRSCEALLIAGSAHVEEGSTAAMAALNRGC